MMLLPDVDSDLHLVVVVIRLAIMRFSGIQCAKVQMISISFEQRQQFVDDPFAQQMRQIRDT
jgi:hypothetical protein